MQLNFSLLLTTSAMWACEVFLGLSRACDCFDRIGGRQRVLKWNAQKISGALSLAQSVYVRMAVSKPSGFACMKNGQDLADCIEW
jgi:hypothetical protein